MPTEPKPLPRGICPACEGDLPIRNGRYVPHLIIVASMDPSEPMVRFCDGSELPMRECRRCGCTEADCRSCIAKTGKPCSWVEDDVCSACAPGQPTLFEKERALVEMLSGRMSGEFENQVLGQFLDEKR